METKPICPNCGNVMFHCRLEGEPYWCGACDLRTHDPRRICPKCRRIVAKGVLWLDDSLKCPA